MTQKRILIPHRIIPTDLYVQRDADRQLRSILDDMASPGYVLVARQMGKTNLLLNAKRSYQKADDVYTYVDLSNSFVNETECFRYIIDKSIDTHQALLGTLKTLIKDIRQNQLPPHLEHLQELRTILNHITGKIVIILDEIDALTRSTYSDKIFSQVRSIYFERDSYSELNRLTYVLSGVVEPTEIIKNPKISPFNIGQKIFLDDFSVDEHNEFINRAKLCLNQAVSNRIYHWTSGNPRMTYDICSETELQVNSDAFGTATIDEIVKRLYLTNFDKAPVDHIRELVSSNKAIRDALLLIRYGRGADVEDHIKTRLYLAGIIGPNFSSAELGIKNRIIEQSLSEAWIAHLDKKTIKPAEVIEKLAKLHDFKQVIEFHLSLSETEAEALSNAARYNIGLAYFKRGEFIKAIELFKSVSYDKTYELSDYLDNHLYLADSYEANGNYDKAIIAYENVIENDSVGKFGMMAMVSLGEVLIDFENGKRRNKAYELLNKVLQSEQATDAISDPDFHRQLMISAHLFYGKLLNRSGQFAEADRTLDEALELADDSIRPVILLAKMNFVKRPDASNLQLNEIVDLIIQKKLLPDAVTKSDIYFSQQNLYEILDNVFQHLPERFNELSMYLVEKYAQQRSIELAIGYYQLGLKAITLQNMLLAKEILEFFLLHDRLLQYDESSLFVAYRFVINSAAQLKDKERFMSNYYEFLAAHPKLVLNSSDLDLLINYADIEILKHDFTRSQAVLNFLTGSLDKSSEELRSSKYLIEFMEIKALNFSFSDVARERSKHLLSALNQLSQQEIAKNPLLKESLPMVKSSLSSLTMVSQPIPRIPTLTDNERVNVQYRNGRIVNGIKFKKVRKDIASGNCRLI